MLISQIISQAEPEAPVLILVHGRAGNLNVMQAFKSVIPSGTSVVSVQAPLEDPEGGYRWWSFDSSIDTSPKTKEAAFTAAKTFIDWLQDFLLEHKLKPRRIIALGFSQGAALLSCVVQVKVSLFYGVALLAGFVLKSPELPETLSAAEPKPRVFFAHGSNDEIVPLSVAQEGANYLNQNGYQVSFVSDSVGHKIGVSGMKALKIWLEECL
jgi:phospholipase/carboxylesterase